jgi:hypothetical protein
LVGFNHNRTYIIYYRVDIGTYKRKPLLDRSEAYTNNAERISPKKNNNPGIDISFTGIFILFTNRKGQKQVQTAVVLRA